ncbi:MAG: insulinase family protein [Treponema sp.]|nr:insulinase family protein [Treponema sp.]
MNFFKWLFDPVFGVQKTAQKASLAALIAMVFAVPVFADKDPLFTLPQNALYGGLGAPEDPVPAKAALRQGALPNGLRYYILENSLPADRAYLTLAVNAGSILEEDDEQGLAHFVEHMAFNGTRRFPGAELVNYLRSLGMRFGPEVNAYTGFEETVYGIETPVEEGEDGVKRIPVKALAILDDWTWTITFDPEDVDRERLVILEEYRTRLGAQERVRRQMLPVIFRGSRFAGRLPIGLPEIIQNAPAEKLKNFYRSWYRPDNMALILVGDFDGAALEKDLAAHFTAPAPDTPLNRPRYELPDPKKGALTTAVITDGELSTSTVFLYYKRCPLASTRTLKDYREELLDYLINTMIDFRFGERIASENTPYMAAGSWNTRYGLLSRYYVMAANVKADRSAETLEALLMEKERLLRYGFTWVELNRAKASILSDLEMMEMEKDRRESENYINEFTADFLQEQAALDIEWEADAIRRLLPAIGLQTVNTTLRNYYIDDDLTVIVTGPEAENLPGDPAIASMVEKSLSAAVTPPLGMDIKPGASGRLSGSVNTFQISEVSEQGTIVSVRQDQSGAEIWELSNGMQLILFETANKNNELDFYALARGGTTSAGAAGTNGETLLDGLGFSPEEALYSAKLAAEIQGASGLGLLSRPDLMDFLSDKQVSLSLWAGTNTRGFQGSSSLKDLPSLFEMLHGSFTHPRIDQAGFALVLDYYRTRLRQDSPERTFSIELARLMFGEHPVFKSMEIADLDHVNEKAALTFLTLALNPADYTLVLAGSLGDRRTLRNLAETWLASIPMGELPRWNNWVDPQVRRPEKTEQIIHKGKEEKSIVYMGWFAPKTWTEEDNAAVLVLSEYLSIVLTDEIRERLGGVYSISAKASFSPIPRGELTLEVYFVCDPKRETELREAVKEQLMSLADAVNKETLSRSKEALVKTFERSMENNSFIARNLANFFVITETPLSRLAQRPALYRSITEENIRSLMAELLTQGPAELILFPETVNK